MKLQIMPMSFVCALLQKSLEKLADAIKRCCKLAKLRSIGWHLLRHTFASHLTMRGMPLRAVQELLGHSTVTMTMRYAHPAPQTKRESVALLDNNSQVVHGTAGTGIRGV